LACEFIQKDGNAIDGAAALEMRLDFLGRSAVIHISNKNTPSIDLLFVLA
jgi:hypothetical protein